MNFLQQILAAKLNKTRSSDLHQESILLRPKNSILNINFYKYLCTNAK